MTRRVNVLTETTDTFCTESIAAPLQGNSRYFLIHPTIINMYIYTVYTNFFILLVTHYSCEGIGLVSYSECPTLQYPF